MHGSFRTLVCKPTPIDEITDPLGPAGRAEVRSLVRQGWKAADAVEYVKAKVRKAEAEAAG